MVKIDILDGTMTVNEQEYEQIKDVLFADGNLRHSGAGRLQLYLNAKDVHDILNKPAFKVIH